MDTALAQRIIKARSARGWSQADLAEISGIAPAQISRYEQGRNAPRPPVLAKLAKALEVDFDWLAMGDSPPSNLAQDEPQKRDKITLKLSSSEHKIFANLAAERGVSVQALVNSLFQELLQNLELEPEEAGPPSLEERITRLEALIDDRPLREGTTQPGASQHHVDERKPKNAVRRIKRAPRPATPKSELTPAKPQKKSGA